MLDPAGKGSQPALTCYLYPESPPCFVHLGKYGDLMILFPGLKAIYEATGIKPVVMVARDFENIFDGITYATPLSVDLNWWRDVALARQWAEQLFEIVIVPKWWEDKNAVLPPVASNEPVVELLMPNRKWTIAAKDWDSFMASQWLYAGFTREQMLSWQLCFDRRDTAREMALAGKWFYTKKPKILVNLPNRGTSVFRDSEAVWSRILRLSGAFEIVDLMRVRAERVYDLLGLYDFATFLITSDTATLHLASASQIPYLALIADGGSGSVPKGNCQCAIRYKDAVRSIPKIDHVLEKLYYDHRGKPDRNLAEHARHGHNANTAGVTSRV